MERFDFCVFARGLCHRCHFICMMNVSIDGKICDYALDVRRVVDVIFEFSRADEFLSPLIGKGCTVP